VTEERNNLPELPTGWAYASLEEISENIVDCPHSTPKFASEGKYCIDTTCIKPGKIVFEKARFVSFETYHERTKRLIPKAGDILFSREGTIGTAVVVPENIELCLGQRMMMFRAASCIIPTYYILALTSPVFENQWKPKVIGTTSPHVNIRDLKIMVLPLPSLNEQHRIVAKIEALKARSQRVKEELEAIPALLDQFRQSVLAAAFRGDLTADWREKNSDVEPALVLLERIRAERRRRWEEAELEKMKAQGKTPKDDKWKAKYDEASEPKLSNLPGIPSGWIWVTLDALIVEGPQNGLYLPQLAYGVGEPILRIDNFQDGWSCSSAELRLVNASCKEVETYSLRKDDIVINRVNSPSHLGKSLLVEERNLPALFESNMMRLRISNAVFPKFIDFYLRSPNGKRALIKNAKWAVNQASINQTDVINTIVPLPPMAEQTAIVNAIGRQFVLLKDVKTSIQSSEQCIETLNQSILAKAFRGELVPQDPNDEPASVLLERIRAEREKLDTNKKAKGKTEKKSRKEKLEAPEPEQLSFPGFE
jgi:type I restriction enzyme S subunit